jgi:DNA (cytosine-5)-methyltransferase 1
VRLLDLFSGAGGAAMGYHHAGFDEVVGVDIAPMPRYPFTFVQGDALEYLAAHGHEFDAIHASPPCQRYSAATRVNANHPDLYAPTRAALQEVGRPYVIENVIGAPYSYGTVLCGTMFGLTADGEWIQRHRNFEASWVLPSPPRHVHPTSPRALLVTGHAFIRQVRDVGRHSRQGPFELACRVMGVDWMNRKELVESIPPAYTKWVGDSLLAQLTSDAPM